MTPELNSKNKPQGVIIDYKDPDTDELIANEITDKFEKQAIEKPIDDKEVILNEDQLSVKENEELEGF